MDNLTNSLNNYYETKNNKLRITPRKLFLLELLLKFVTYSDRVLDLGCGDGFLSLCLGAITKGAIGIDRSIGKKILTHKKITFCSADITDSKFDFDNIDIVLLLDVLEHIPKEKERGLLDKAIKSLSKYLIINLPVQQDSSQPMDRKVHPVNIINYVGRKMTLIYLETFSISDNESYTFLVFKK